MVIFDFDGVIIDSLDEVLVTACNSVSEERVTRLSDLPAGFEALFRRNRFHVQPAADFPVLADWCLRERLRNPGRLLRAAEFEAIIKGAKRPPEERRHRFFEARKRFFNEQPSAWFDLNHPYRPLWEALVERGPDKMVILTNKNKPPVLALCRHFGFSISPDTVYSAESGATKTENFEAIRRRFQQPRYYFIDDSLGNLRDIRRHFNGADNLKLLFAEWGYVGPEDATKVENSDFKRVSQEEFIAFLNEYDAGRVRKFHKFPDCRENVSRKH